MELPSVPSKRITPLVIALLSKNPFRTMVPPGFDWLLAFDSSRINLGSWWELAPIETAVSVNITSPVPSSFAILSLSSTPAALAFNCNGGKYVSSSDSTTRALPAVSPVPASRTIIPSPELSASNTSLLPLSSTNWYLEVSITLLSDILAIISLPSLKLSSNRISSESPVSIVTLTTSSNVVSSNPVVESQSLTVPVCVVSVLAAAKVPVTSFKTKLALKVKSGAVE